MVVGTEIEAFFWVIAAGAAVGLSFDIYRAVRKHLNWGRALTFIGDLLFSLAALALLIYFFLKANALAFRLYIFWGSLLGLFLYSALLSSKITNIFLHVLAFLSWLWHKVLIGIKFPFRLLGWIMTPFYAILRWFSLLFFRMGQVLFGPLWQKGVVKVSFWRRWKP